ncbi:MAG: peptidoglycan DD-metalloendopeptidase family protein [Clostridia bacterium]|nr:peptidoglycan DD-metalloendopeptidase family protein [Clostridia bacterium]
MNSTAKKQNRILLVTLVVILSAAALLIAVTGSANKKAKSNEEPPVETFAETKTAETTAKPVKPAETEASEDKQDMTSEPAETEKPEKSSGDTAAREAAAIQNDSLPRFCAPVNGMVLKDYSDDIPVFSCTMDDYRTHNGLDFACSPGTPVYASAEGVICEVDHDPMMGVTVGVQHSGGAVTRYMGLSEESLYLTQPGQNVKAGQMIGAAGDTALIESAEEGHMHFELTVNGEYKNPADYMKVSYLTDVYED